MNIGFMQGRLSPLVGGKIQAFPWLSWQEEFQIAENNNFSMMEWTIDNERLYENPLMTKKGQREIRILCDKHNVSIPSLTGDCFMQSPFWKEVGKSRSQRCLDFIRVIEACSDIGIEKIVVPIVDNGSLDNSDQEDCLVNFLLANMNLIRVKKVKITFESDMNPDCLASFIKRFPEDIFGVNYDIGNSAALGYDFSEEFAVYGHRILNVHVKDRLFEGTTVPLGSGAAKLPNTIKSLQQIGYKGNYILQTARAEDDDHIGVLDSYRNMVKQWLEVSH